MKKTDEKGDVGLEEDLIFMLKNNIAAEDHALNSFFMTEDTKWMEVNDVLRKIRTKWMQLLVKKLEEQNDQRWCLSKHLLATIMGLQEVANRFYSTNQKKESKEAETDASTLMGIFLNINEIGEE